MERVKHLDANPFAMVNEHTMGSATKTKQRLPGAVSAAGHMPSDRLSRVTRSGQSWNKGSSHWVAPEVQKKKKKRMKERKKIGNSCIAVSRVAE